MQRDLKEHGIKVGICRIRKIRKKLGIRCKQTKKFKATTDSKHKLPVADNTLEQNFKANAPNKIWVSDVTYIPTDEGLSLIHISEPTRLLSISYAVFCLKKKNTK